jgi:hypothetical protein
MGLVAYFVLGAGSAIGLLLGSGLSVISVHALRRLDPGKPERDPEPRLHLSEHEQRRFGAFGRMSLNDVRERAEEFEAAREQFDEWVRTRRERRGHALGPDEQEGYASEVQSGDPAKRWRALEAERLEWARRRAALSDLLSRPERRWLGQSQRSPSGATPRSSRVSGGHPVIERPPIATTFPSS